MRSKKLYPIHCRFILLFLGDIFLSLVFGIYVAARAMEIDVDHFGGRDGRSFHAFIAKGSFARGQRANIQITSIHTHSAPLNLKNLTKEKK